MLLLCQHEELRSGSQTQHCSVCEPCLFCSWPWGCLGLLAQGCDSSLSIPTIRDRAEKCSAYAAMVILPGGERLPGVRMAEIGCAISRGPIPLLRKGGQMRQSSSSTKKMGFVLCHSGIIGMSSVPCTRQVRPCHQPCLCPAQQCGEFPESKECFHPSA